MISKKMIVILMFLTILSAGAVFAIAAENEGNDSGFGPWKKCRPDNETVDVHARLMNDIYFNSTVMEEFRNAVINNDYQTAKKLNEEYGVGGHMFSSLNGTTFAKYSEIAVLHKELMAELGINQTEMQSGPMGHFGSHKEDCLRERMRNGKPDFEESETGVE
ncbi:hypothetical protein KJ780_02815 [Candidatus Micrarchaeota archaeon]|nr:hypothetical protein [Candidatus Micrarchaeota archaeon]